jgi:cyclophilin family peptidyl-prolyl cis-trans isomerase
MAWAKSAADPDGTAGSQFFIGTGPGVATLPLQYGIIGTVTKGLDVAQKIEGFAPSGGDGPLTTKVTIKKVTIAESGGATTTTTAPATSSSAP